MKRPPKPKPKWKLVDSFPITNYRCGARAGERVRLRRDLVITQGGKPTGKVYRAGGIWRVVRGAREEPRVLWLKRPDEETHTWHDDERFWAGLNGFRKRKEICNVQNGTPTASFFFCFASAVFALETVAVVATPPRDSCSFTRVAPFPRRLRR